MLRFFFSSILLLLAHWSASAQGNTTQYLEALERQRFEAMTGKNLSFLHEVLSDKLSYTHSNGLVETKTQLLDNLEKGNLVYRTIQPESIHVKIFRKSAVITGIIDVSGVLRDKEFHMRLRYTDMYVKQKGKWKLVAWQSGRAE